MTTRAATWTETTIGEAYTFTSKPRGLPMPKQIPFIPMEALTERGDHIDDNRVKFVESVSSGTYVEKGDFVLAKITPSFENGKQGFIEIDSPFAYATTEVIPIQPRNGVSNKYFLAYWLRQSDIRSVLAGKMEGTTGRQRLSKSVLEKTTISLPPISEQESIAHILTVIQIAISEQENLIAKLRELKRSMMQHLFTHGTRGEKTKMTEIGEMPESWSIFSVGELCDVKGGKRLPKGENLTSENTGLPYIRVTDLNDNTVDQSGLLYLTPEIQKQISRYTISTKDVYISIAGSIGFVGIIPAALDGANLTENAAKLCIRSVATVNQRYLMYWLSGKTVQKDIKSQTVKNAQPKLALARIQQLPLVLPTLEEQKKIAFVIDSIQERLKLAEERMVLCESLFKTLLHELMGGERRLNLL